MADARGSYRFMTIPAAEGRLSAADRPVTQEQLEAARDAVLALLPCGCVCHEWNGGPWHPGARCVCNGGTGMDDCPEVKLEDPANPILRKM